MATARPLYDAALWEIEIAVGGTVSQNGYMKVGSLNSFKFKNNAGFPVNIVFQPTGTGFTNINNLANGLTSASQGGVATLNFTINYLIYDANVPTVPTGGPYAIQFGIGPLEISITDLTPNIDPIAVPNGGQIQFTSEDNTYNIGWTQNNQPINGAWSPQPGTIYPGINGTQTAQPVVNSKTVVYSLSNQQERRGGGTVNMG